MRAQTWGRAGCASQLRQRISRMLATLRRCWGPGGDLSGAALWSTTTCRPASRRAACCASVLFFSVLGSQTDVSHMTWLLLASQPSLLQPRCAGLWSAELSCDGHALMSPLTFWSDAGKCCRLVKSCCSFVPRSIMRACSP
jgi:hypothetical protein